ncbi:MAG: NADH-quinone oxidoreductase subunit C [Chloroflexi bacterium]|nr:NADH-quinone oxidoreductase subunit C [Chloroflexota bacterium]
MTSPEERLQAAQQVLASWAGDTQSPEPNRLDVGVAAQNLIAAIEALIGARWGYLSAITGLDLGVEAGQIEVLYHFCEGAAVLTLRVATPRASASVPSVCPLIPSASVFERELVEMMGIQVVGTPDNSRLFLADDWPDDVYPLRKDAVLERGVKEQGNE